MKRVTIVLITFLSVLFLCACGSCKHAFVAANCISPATCTKCGATSGEPLGHLWSEATCTAPAQCERCGQTRGEALGHDWSSETCVKAKECSRCEMREGKPLGHTWMDATCTEPKTCSVCGAVEGKALDHTVAEWEIITAASCTEEGIEAGICTMCNSRVEQTIPKTEHQPSEWKMIVPAKKDAQGHRVKNCTVCGEELENESFTLTPDEIEAEYKAQCKSIGYKELQRNPKNHIGEHIKLSGTIFQVISEAKSALQYSLYFVRAQGDLYLLRINNYSADSRILEDDKITVWGEVEDLFEYKTVRGTANIVPTILVEYFK